jgi:demethylmenaquinone methyltransferase/2-methoxy-6-polyprenyl-1,4-benzoquinol methylase
MQPRKVDAVSSLLSSQREFYDERAEDFGDESKPSDRRVRELMPPHLARDVVDEFRPVGRVLEIACGTGSFTDELVRFADSVTALDASPRMLAIAESRIRSPKVSFVESDIFDWEPDAPYDAVFFGHWLSHVPPPVFDDFWAIVRDSLAPGGRVGFVEEDDRASEYDDVYPIADVPAARRRLADGREFEIVKVFWRPDELEERLRSSDWNITVRRLGPAYLYGVGQPR